MYGTVRMVQHIQQKCETNSVCTRTNSWIQILTRSSVLLWIRIRVLSFYSRNSDTTGPVANSKYRVSVKFSGKTPKSPQVHIQENF
jgi:hypothetical protein